MWRTTKIDVQQSDGAHRLVRHIALIGHHGSGKGTAGQLLQSLGYMHWSIGDIRRQIHGRQTIEHVPPIVVAAVRRAKAGAPLPLTSLKVIVAAAEALPLCVIDGLPDGVEHASHIPSSWRVIHVLCPDVVRMDRLRRRADETGRFWQDGGSSPRDDRLRETLESLPDGALRTVNNDDSLAAFRDRIILAAHIDLPAASGRLPLDCLHP